MVTDVFTKSLKWHVVLMYLPNDFEWDYNRWETKTKSSRSLPGLLNVITVYGPLRLRLPDSRGDSLWPDLVIT